MSITHDGYKQVRLRPENAERLDRLTARITHRYPLAELVNALLGIGLNTVDADMDKFWEAMGRTQSK